jgi:carboxyl-terminal processing protease
MEKNSWKKRVIFIMLAIIFIVAGFIGGFVSGRLTDKSALASYEWAMKTIKENYYEDISDEDMLNVSLKEIADDLLDEYSAYYTAEEYAKVLSSNAGSKSGIGVSYSYLDCSLGKGIYVASVVGNSPVYNSGLKAGTFITGAIYNDKQTTFDNRQSFIDFIASLNTDEKFTFITDKGNFEMAKSDYTASYCFMSTNTTAWDCTYEGDNLKIVESTSTEKVVSYLPDGAAYISLSQFYGNAKNELAQLVARFNANGCTSLILDLRSNGGGYVEVMQYISSLFTTNRNGSTVAITAKYKSGKETVFSVKNFASGDSLVKADTKIYVLANSNTASASEALIGVLISCGAVNYSDIYLSDYSEEYLNYFGTTKTNRTYGKGIMQSPFTNPATGEVLKLTTAKIYWPNGNCIHGTGITVADGCNSVKAAWSKTYNDEELRSAVSAIFG